MTEEAAVHSGVLPMNLLVVDDEQYIRQLCADAAAQSGMKVTAVATAEEALAVLENSVVDILMTDLKLPESSELDLLQPIHDSHPEVAVIVLTQYGTIDSAVTATRLGAVDYVTKPFRLDELRTRLERVAQAVELQQENRLLREQLRPKPGFGGLIGVSAKMQRIYKMIEKVSQHEYPVLILGESGTGKEMVARSVHSSGPRKDRSFAAMDCSSLVPTLIESELFGYVKGAFTGAIQAKQGLLEAAAGGTLFLDEIADMPVDLQAKLLRALQEREVKPVGSTERGRINVRVIAATNRDVESAIRMGAFRQDLYFRLNVVQLKLPALRDRKSDIPLLVTSYLEKFSGMHGATRTISDEAMRSLIAYDWPGNVRELENAIERAVALGSGPIVHVGDLPSNLQYSSSERAPDRNEILPLEELERRAILKLPQASNRILVVEDEPTVARLIADVLRDEGFQVDVLLDGREALEQAGRENYDLVICEMKMPGLDGQHFYKGLVEAGNRLSERFLFVTGDVVSQHTQRFMEHHHLPHVAKPFRMEELKDEVHSVLELHFVARPAETEEHGMRRD